MKATISISKTITCIKYVGFKTIITEHKLSDLSKVVNSLESLKLTSQAIKPAKLNKYINILTDLGFTLISADYNNNCGFEGINSNCSSVSINFNK